MTVDRRPDRAPLSSLNLLRTFEVAARHRSFKVAAHELCVTASAVSQQIKNLEDQLGVALFERHPRGLALTEVGRRYLASIQPHLAAIDEATWRLAAGESALLRVSVLPPLASRVVLPRLAGFREIHPTIELHIDTTLRTVDLQQRTTDVAIRYGSPPWPGCLAEKLLEVSAQPVCPAALAERLGLVGHPERLAQAPLVHMTERPESWSWYLADLGIAETPDASFHVDDYPAAIEAGQSVGVALALMPLEASLLASGRVVAVGPRRGPLPGAIHAVMLEEKRHDPAIEAFVTWLRAQLALLDPDRGVATTA